MTEARSWSPLQEKIFQHIPTAKNLAVIARAGSGKSTTIEEAVRRVPKNSSVLVCAFNRDIRDELSRRVPFHVHVKTLNQMGFGGLMRFWDTKLEVDPNRQKELAKKVIPQSYHGQPVSDVVKIVAMAMASMASSENDLRAIMEKFDCTPVEDCSEEDYVRWTQEILKRSEEKSISVSYDDQVYLAAKFNVNVGKYDYVFVDEAQDLNVAQKVLVQNAIGRGGKVVFVGDPEQAIYGFRGADSDSMQRMIESFKADVLPLSVSYRCPKAVVALAQKIVPDFQAAPSAVEGAVKVVSVEDLEEGVRSSDFIVSRLNGPLVHYCLEFLAEGRKAVIRGKDVGAGLLKIVRMSQANTIKEFQAWLQSWCTKQIEKLVHAGQDAKAEELYDKSLALQSIAASVNTMDQLRAKLEQLFQDHSPEKAIVLSSAHKAKGLEAPRVWLLEQTFRRGASKEEDNLLYVAITRAKSTLFLVQVPNRRGEYTPSIADETEEDR